MPTTPVISELQSPPPSSIRTPADWWANLIYWLDHKGKPQGNIPSRMRAPDCYPHGLESPSIMEFCRSYYVGRYSPIFTIEGAIQSDRLEGAIRGAVERRDHSILLSIINAAWFNGPGQCGQAWNVMCDLCSECWVFDEQEGEAE